MVSRRPIRPGWLVARSDRQYHVVRPDRPIIGELDGDSFVVDRTRRGSAPDLKIFEAQASRQLVAVSVEECKAWSLEGGGEKPGRPLLALAGEPLKGEGVAVQVVDRW